LDGINAVSTPQVAFLANSGSSPVVLRMANEKEGKVEIDEKSTYVVMPIKN
jgi:DNA polymerase III sliding clamp (beta) subunit (PCNA family)